MWHVLYTKQACERCTSNTTSAFNLQDLLKRPRIHQIYTKRACEDRIQTASALQFRLRAFYLIEQPISLTIRKGWLQGMKKRLSNNSNNSGRSREELDVRWYENYPPCTKTDTRLQLLLIRCMDYRLDWDEKLFVGSSRMWNDLPWDNNQTIQNNHQLQNLSGHG